MCHFGAHQPKRLDRPPGGFDAYRAFVIGTTVLAVATVRMVATRL
jgi:hypothetical protein